MPRPHPIVLITLCTLTGARGGDPPPPDYLTEGTAHLWGWGAQSGSAQLGDDASRRMVGAWSVRYDTDAPFDAWLYAPATGDAAWDLLAAGADGPSFWIYAQNPNGSFQGDVPLIRLCTTAADYIEYGTGGEWLNRAIGAWAQVRLPLNGTDTWRPRVVGQPDLSVINWIEIHADTWDAGFTLWIDGLAFDVGLGGPANLTAAPGNSFVELRWDRFEPPPGGGLAAFGHYAVYRDTEPINSLDGMTPVGRVFDQDQTAYTDTGVVNGQPYYYAVTAVLTGGFETPEFPTVGPRTPRDETDLQMLSMRRTPRYPRYAPTYTQQYITDPSGYGPYLFSAATGLGDGQTGQTQRWPDIGDTVAYTATVRNRGTNPWIGTLSASWTVDGQVVSTPARFVGLGPGDTAEFVLEQTWDGLDHEIIFVMDPADDRPGNNIATIWSRSVGFLSCIDESYMEDFRAETPSYPNPITDDFVDWLHAHMARFNAMFADAECPKRVHFDVLEVLADSAPDPDTERIYFAIFPFRYRAGSGSLRQSGYYHPSEDLDYGLLHEMGHQLGLVDLYRLDLPASRNFVSGEAFWAVEGLMHGVSPFLSAHSANGMSHWQDVAHGYYGQYMYQMPQRITVRVLGRDGRTVPDASMRLYQKNDRPGQGEVLTSQIKAEGTTDNAGLWTLPNVPIEPGLVPPTFAGDVLRDNPFGYLDVVGRNGLLLIEAERDGEADYVWLSITDVNDAYWAGNTQEAVFTRAFAIGGGDNRYPPLDLAEFNAGVWWTWAHTGGITATDDTSVVQSGEASLRLDGTGTSDHAVAYPGSLDAAWDLTDVREMRLWVRAEPGSSFENSSPWVILNSPDGFYLWQSAGEPLNDAIGQWVELVIPIRGDATWIRTQVGQPTLAQVSSWELHADPAGTGFTAWLDGVRFVPMPCLGDFDRDGTIDSRDFIAYLNAFTAGDPIADVNADGVINSVDFLEFLNAFVSGC